MCVFIIMAVFTTSGTFMLLFLAALQNIDESVNEAAALDGATEWRKFRYITVPMIRPTIFTVVTLGLIGTWQIFDQIYVGTKGSPSNTTLTPAFLSFNASFNATNGESALRSRSSSSRSSSSSHWWRGSSPATGPRSSTAPLRPTQGLGIPDASRVALGKPGASREQLHARIDATAVRRRRVGRVMTYSFLIAVAIIYSFRS